MSLGKTLVKLAIGVAIVKGVSTLAKGNAGTTTAGRGTPYGDGRPGGLEDVMKDVLAGGTARRSADTEPKRGESTGGAGDLLDQVMRGRESGAGRSPSAEPDDEDRVFTPTPRPPPHKTGGRAAPEDDGRIFTPTPRPPRRNAPKGGLDDLLARSDAKEDGGLGGLLEAVLGGTAPTTLPEPKAREEELAAALALRAMLQAVKSDGTLDPGEKRKLLEQMGDATREEVAFINAELQRPTDPEGLARQVPNGMEEQVYLVSLMAIDLDNQREAKYLAALAQALELSPDEVNRLHDRLGAPRMFR